MSKFKIRDRVRADGHEEVFAVFYVNEKGRWADLACIERVGFVMQVPLGQIRWADAEDEESA